MTSKQPKRSKKSTKSTLNKDDIADCLNNMKQTFASESKDDTKLSDSLSQSILSSFESKNNKPSICVSNRKVKSKNTKLLSPKKESQNSLTTECNMETNIQIKEEPVSPTKQSVNLDNSNKNLKRNHVKIKYEELDEVCQFLIYY